MRRLAKTAVLVSLAGVLLSTSAQAETITLEWSRNTEPSVLGYRLSYGTQSGVYTAQVDVGNNVTYSVNLNPQAATTYFFAVQAYSADSVSPYSAEVSTTVASPGSSPLINIDMPTAGSVLPSDMLLSGWAIDRGSSSGTGIDTLHVYAYPTGGGAPRLLGAAAYGSSRGDVAAAFGSQFESSGFTLPVVGLPPGVYDLSIYGHSTVVNAFNVVASVRVTVYSPSLAPIPSGTIVTLDLPVANSTVRGWLAIGGWAIDRRSTSGTGVDVVQIWAYPNPGTGSLPWFLGLAKYGRARNDVASVFGSRFQNSGFHLDAMGLPPGLYDIVAIARNTLNGRWETARVKRVTVDPAILITVDSPANKSTVSRSFWIGGWALDRRAVSDAGVDVLHVHAYPVSGEPPIFLGEAVVGEARADVAAAFGPQYSFTGFNLPVSNLTPGDYDLVIFAHSSVTSMFENVRIVRVTVR